MGSWVNGSESQATTSFNEHSKLVVKPHWQFQHCTGLGLAMGTPSIAAEHQKTTLDFPTQLKVPRMFCCFDYLTDHVF